MSQKKIWHLLLFSGLLVKADPSPAKSSKAVTVGGVSGPVGLVVAGPRTAVLVGGGSTPPGVDLDQIAANMSNEKGSKGQF